MKESPESYITPAYGARADIEPIAKNEIPENSLQPDVAYDLIRDELILDGNSLVPN